MDGNISELLGEDFDTNSVEPAAGFEALPAGWYPVQISNAEIMDTRSGTGKYLKLELEVIGDHHAGRRVFARMNIVNPNPQAVQIAMRELAAVGQALNLAAITDTAELIGGQLQVKLVIKAEAGQEPQNEVKGYKPLGETASPAAQAPRQAPVAAAPVKATTAAAKPVPAATATAKPAAGMRPWQRKK
jgi:hypothetical protein